MTTATPTLTQRVKFLIDALMREEERLERTLTRATLTDTAKASFMGQRESIQKHLPELWDIYQEPWESDKVASLTTLANVTLHTEATALQEQVDNEGELGVLDDVTERRLLGRIRADVQLIRQIGDVLKAHKEGRKGEEDDD